jgi:hypothetical protein
LRVSREGISWGTHRYEVECVCEGVVALYVHGCEERGLSSVVDCVRVELERHSLAALTKRNVVCLNCGVADVKRLKQVDEVVGRVLAVLEQYLELLRGLRFLRILTGATQYQ